MVYRAGHAALEIFEQPDAEVLEQASSTTSTRSTRQPAGIVRETILLKLPRMLPYAAPGRVGAASPRSSGRSGALHLAGDYLGGVYTDTAISSGQEAALAVRTALQAAAPDS